MFREYNLKTNHFSAFFINPNLPGSVWVKIKGLIILLNRAPLLVVRLWFIKIKIL